jgi:hypothetical protein
MANETLTLSVDGGANFDVQFGTESTLDDITGVIDTALQANGGFAKKLNWRNDTRYDAMIIMASSSLGVGAEIEVVSGTGTVLSKLGLKAGETGKIDDIVRVGGLGRYPLLMRKYMYPEPSPHLNMNWENSANFSTRINHSTPSTYLSMGSAIPVAWRNGGSTSAIVDKTFNLSGSYNLFARLFMGLREGDKIIIENTADAGTYTVDEILYANGEQHNGFYQVKVKEAFPVGGQTNVQFYVELKDIWSGLFCDGTHGWNTPAVIGHKYFGVAPECEISVHLHATGSYSNALRAAEHIVQTDADIMVWPWGLWTNDAGTNKYYRHLALEISKTGKLFCNALGVEGMDLNTIPKVWSYLGASYPLVVGISAAGPQYNTYDENFPIPGVNYDSFATYSNWGKGFVDFAAPANYSPFDFTHLPNYTLTDSGMIYSNMFKSELEAAAFPAGVGVALFGGNSAAVCHFAGVAALVMSALRTEDGISESNRHMALAIMKQTAEDKVGDPDKDKPGKDGYYGFGRPNARKAVNKAVLVRS